MLFGKSTETAPILSREEAEKLLKEKFQLEHFHDLQWTAISAVLRGERVLLIEKTGFGKSLCYQFPALLLDGLTVVFSPLIALMRDQVNKLTDMGIAAKCLNSQQSKEQNLRIINEAKEGLLKILYIAPERQHSHLWQNEVRGLKISMVVVDEAHCISVWGHDFRPAYRRIIRLVKLLPKNMPVLAVTATATPRVKKDLATQITGRIKVIRGNLLRENFKLYVVNVSSDNDKLIWLGQNVPKLQGTGVVYTGTVMDTEVISRWFDELKIPARSYNGKMEASSRIEVEQGLLNNTWKCVISTNALGMGIDKPDIRFIIHTQFPSSPLHYYQEIGRAGRDGKEAIIILLYNPEDRKLPDAFNAESKPSLSKYKVVIATLRKGSLDEKQLMKLTNLRETQFRVLCADLVEQGIIREIDNEGYTKYEYIRGAGRYHSKVNKQHLEAKKKDVEAMIGYAETRESRMKYLCTYLGDTTKREYENCDNTTLSKHTANSTDDWKWKLEEFQANYFPALNTEYKGSKLINGVAASFYGKTIAGTTIHRCKYCKGGDYPQWLVYQLVRAYRKRFSHRKFDVILYVPPSVSGNLVRHMAEKFSALTGIPVLHILVKSRATLAQKELENIFLKEENIAGAFKLENPELVRGKGILLLDDVYDSGATIREIGKLITSCGADEIAPLVLAKTVGGDRL